MKYFFYLAVFSLLFSGCSSTNAFSNFDMSKKQELSEASLQNSKIRLGEKVDGIISAVYLNEVYPEAYNQNEYFYVYIYLKKDAELENPNSFNESKLKLKLNSQLPVKIEELKRDNRFSDLTSVQNEWNRYYLVSFEKQASKLSLVLENGQSLSDELIYQKDEQ